MKWNEKPTTKKWAEMEIGEIRILAHFDTCVACGARYRPKYMKVGPMIKDTVCVSDHRCHPARLAKREEELKHEWDDPERYCECDELDCKFEYLDQIKCDME